MNRGDKMKDKIMKILPPQSATPFDMDATAQAILDLIAKELPKDFEKWLMEYHCETHPEILDDNLPDAFEDWLCNIDADDLIDICNKFLKAIKHKLGVE